MTPAQLDLLWLWSTAVQLISALMVALFFNVLARTLNRRQEVLLWNRAWQANLLAILVSVLYWQLAVNRIIAEGGIAFHLIVFLYVLTKTLFVVLLLEGTWASRHTGVTLLSREQSSAAVAAFALLCGIAIPSIRVLGTVQHSLLTIMLLGAAWVAWRSKERRLRWLSAAFIVRGSAAAFEVATYASPQTWAGSMYPSVSSSFDAGIEWAIALASVLVVSDRINDQLEKANDKLSNQAETDALTELKNRRALPMIFREMHGKAAKLLFFDLDGFKQINDTMGHAAGDQALVRFGNALRASFRPDDKLVRYAGDEFLVLAPGIDRERVDERLEVLRQRLADPSPEGPAVRFSVGITDIAPGEKCEDALKSADAAMYERKQRRKREKVSA
jgi:diguanylate cyclase (GGDEF)-like protein